MTIYKMIGIVWFALLMMVCAYAFRDEFAQTLINIMCTIYPEICGG